MKKHYLPAAIAISLLLAGCTGKTPEEHFTAATEYAAEQRYAEAIIELKSAVSAAPDNADYRVLLGNLYLQNGDFISAEKEFVKALENGAALDEIGISLVQASYRAESYQTVLGYFKDRTDVPASLERYINFYQALSEIDMGVAEEALTTFDKLADAPETDLKLYAQAVLQIKNNAPAEALSLIAQIAESAVTATEALLLKAQLKATLLQTDAALTDFYSYLQQVPNSLRTRLTVAQIQLQEQQLDKADEQLNIILRFAPDHGFTNYLKAVVSFEKKDFTPAKEKIDKALANNFNTTQARVLAGLIHYQLGLNTQALVHLSSVQAQLGVYPPAQRLFVALQLQAGEITQAANTINNQDLTTEDVNLAAATAFELIRAGEANLANDIITRIESAGLNQDSQTLASLGQLKLGLPEQREAAMRDLEQALLLDPGRHDTRLTLAATYIRQQQFDKANDLANAWLAAPETANLGYNLKALTALLTGNIAEGERLLAQASLADSTNPFTKYLRAAVAQEQQQPEQAIELLMSAVQTSPEYIPAYQALFSLYNQQNKDSAALLALVKKAVTAAPQNQALADFQLSALQQLGKNKDIIALVEPKLKSPEQLSALANLAIASAYAAENQLAKALSVTERWYKQDERNQQAALAYANVLALSKRPKEALQIVEAQLRRSNANPNLTVFKIALLTELNEYQSALNVFSDLPQDLASQAQVLFQKGRLQLLAGQIMPGLETLLDSYSKNAAPLTAIAIAEAYAKDISYKKAVDFLEDHMQQQGNTNARLYGFYGSLLVQSDLNKARDVYQQIAEQEPDNPLVLNNYAWMLAEVGEPKKAQPYIEKALKLQPGHPDMLDTYGKVLLLSGQLDKALEQFEKSLEIRPNNAEVLLNYAEALIKQGNLTQAKAVLAKVNPTSAELKARLVKLNANL